VERKVYPIEGKKKRLSFLQREKKDNPMTAKDGDVSWLERKVSLSNKKGEGPPNRGEGEKKDHHKFLECA